jgi:large subunit ribosomal protein L18
LIDDITGVTLSSSSTRDKEFKTKAGDKIKPVDAAKLVGNLLATKAVAKKIQMAVFDKSGYQYHGRVRALADGARQAGLKF